MKSLACKFLVLGFSAALAGCGGGAAYVDVGSAAQSKFLFWPGSSGGDRVIDGLSHQFGFYADNGCLFNAQTGQENTVFCLPPNSNVVTYGAFQGQVLNVIVADGTCHAAILDSFTGNFSDIEVDAYGREVVLTTQLHPARCAH